MTGIVVSGRGVVSRRIGCEIVIVMCMRPLEEMACCWWWYLTTCFVLGMCALLRWLAEQSSLLGWLSFYSKQCKVENEDKGNSFQMEVDTLLDISCVKVTMLRIYTADFVVKVKGLCDWLLGLVGGSTHESP